MKVSDEFKKEVEQGAIAATDKLRGKLEKIKAEQKEPMSAKLKTAFEDLYEKSSPSHTASMRELKEAADRLKEELGKTPDREILKALHIFAADIQQVTQGFTFMDEIPVGQLAQKPPVQKAAEVKNEKENAAAKERVRISIGDLQKKDAEEKALDAVNLPNKDKITAQDILDVRIDVDNKKSSGADREKLRKSIVELQEMEGIGVEKDNNKKTAEVQRTGKTNTKKVLLTV